MRMYVLYSLCSECGRQYPKLDGTWKRPSMTCSKECAKARKRRRDMEYKRRRAGA